MAGWLQAVVVVAVLAGVHVPLGDYLARVYTARRHWRVEAALYRVCGIDPDAEQRWKHYLISLLALSAVGVLVLYALLRLQAQLPWAAGHPDVSAGLAFNTAVSFTTNTSWQNYAGESTVGHCVQAAGLGVEAFASAAVGLAVGVALIRGLARHRTDTVGNFWVDLVRSITRLLLPLSFLFAIVLVALGVIQNLHDPQAITALAGGRQVIPAQYKNWMGSMSDGTVQVAPLNDNALAGHQRKGEIQQVFDAETAAFKAGKKNFETVFSGPIKDNTGKLQIPGQPVGRGRYDQRGQWFVQTGAGSPRP